VEKAKKGIFPSRRATSKTWRKSHNMPKDPRALTNSASSMILAQRCVKKLSGFKMGKDQASTRG
jgi:hypothetical protein